MSKYRRVWNRCGGDVGECYMIEVDSERKLIEPRENRAARAHWERPALRRLAANEAQGGPQPCNDGQGGGGCNSLHHS